MTKSTTPCKDCGAEHYSTAFVKCAEKEAMDREGVCFTCAYWRVQVTKPHSLVIDGRIYSLGDVSKPPNSPHAGMAGRRFDIEFFDGRRVTTHDLWGGADVPERYKEMIPDTARFLNGAGFVKVGDVGCWNSSTQT